MLAEVKRLWSEDLDLVDAKSLPSNPEDCCAGMYADIGPVGAEGADTFSFEVCTPSGLAGRLDVLPAEVLNAGDGRSAAGGGVRASAVVVAHER